MKKIILVTITLLSTNLLFAQTSNSNPENQERKVRTEKIDQEEAKKLEAQKLATIKKQKEAQQNPDKQKMRDDGKPIEIVPTPAVIREEKQPIPDKLPSGEAPRRSK